VTVSLAGLLRGPQRHTLMVCTDTGQWWELIDGHRDRIGSVQDAEQRVRDWGWGDPDAEVNLTSGHHYTVARVDRSTLEALPMHPGQDVELRP